MDIDLIESFVSNLKYNITGYNVVEGDEIIMYVGGYNAFQNEIPKNIDGLKVEIVIDS